MTEQKSSTEAIEIESLGLKFSLRSQSDPEVIREAVALAKLKIRDIERRKKGRAAHEVTLLALLDLAEDYVRAKHRANEHRTAIIEKTERLAALVEMDQ